MTGNKDKGGTIGVLAGARALPWRRLGTARDIGRAAVFLASDDADYITGSVLRVDGGLMVTLGLSTPDQG